MQIQEIDRPMRVLSWSAKNNRFELALSGGAFPKGVASLYRVVTQQGEFVASGHHRVLCADHKYRQVADLTSGCKLLTSSQTLLRSSLGAVPQSLHADDPHSLRTIADSMGRYADAARQYGLRLLLAKGICQDSVQESSDAQECSRLIERADDLLERELTHTRLDQLSSRICRNGLLHHVAPREAGEARQRCEVCFEHACQSIQSEQQFQQKKANRQQAQEFSTVESRREGLAFSAALEQYRKPQCTDTPQPYRIQQSLQHPSHCGQAKLASKPVFRDQSCNHSLIESCNIISVSLLDSQEAYYDLQVLDNNNYVTVDGAIHHNSGKTWAGCAGIAMHFCNHPKVSAGYFAPTYPQIRDIFYPTIEEVLHDWGMRCQIKTSDKEVDVYTGNTYRGTVICRSLDRPETIVGFKIGHALIDELDVMKEDKAQLAWRKIIARMRYKVDGLRNGVDVTTTPEGFKFTYRQFVEQLSQNDKLCDLYGIVHASTYDNESNLPDDYIPSLVASYPKELISAYINGQFVNLTSGSVYPSYSRERCRSKETIQQGETLYIGQDFNVYRMTSVIFVKRTNGFHAVAELVDLRDTPQVIRTIKDRWPSSKIVIYPDSSGKSAKSSDASVSDIALLQQAGFETRFKPTNPAVRDRVMSVNKSFEAGLQWVNDATCPKYAQSLEQQVYDKAGEPDKSSGKDHATDAGGYVIAYEFPIHRPVLRTKARF